MQKKSKKPWPTKRAMQQVYALHFWGGNKPFYSGEGSHSDEIVTPYTQVVGHFLKQFKQKISVCDLGCGDFNVGEKLLPFVSHYTAVDIVPELIEYNNQKFKYNNLTFLSLDISKEILPQAECAILRQVLQHLSNSEVQEIAAKLHQYKYVILTEHLPNGDFIPNMDIISGRGIRIKKNSGVDLFEAPFFLKARNSIELLAVDLGQKKGRIVTWLITF